MASSIDKQRLPRGSRGWRTFVEGLAQVDDTAETHWLEMKSTLDLSRAGSAKVAKFILGAANRMPDVAASALDGYAIMVLGVAEGALVGIAPVEDLELEQRLAPFLGAEGPHWDTERVGVSGGRDVLVIIVDPPKPGDPIHVCRKDGDGVADGDVYFRARGETRRAKSGELDLLRARELGGVPNVELEVAVTEPARAYVCAPEVLEEYIEGRERGPPSSCSSSVMFSHSSSFQYRSSASSLRKARILAERGARGPVCGASRVRPSRRSRRSRRPPSSVLTRSVMGSSGAGVLANVREAR